MKHPPRDDSSGRLAEYEEQFASERSGEVSDYDDLMSYLETLPATRDPDCTGTAADLVRGRIVELERQAVEDAARYGADRADVAMKYEERIAELERELLEARCELADARKEVNYRVRSEENALSVADRENARLHELERRIEIKTEEANRYLVERDALREAAQKLVNDIFESSRLRPFTVACEDVEAFRAALDTEHGAVPERSKGSASSEETSSGAGSNPAGSAIDAEANGWGTIDTAPKDRLIILAKYDSTGTQLWWICKGCWSEKYGRWWDQLEPYGLTGPTHWRRLLEPPGR